MADVFISYSHKDLKWKDRLLVQLTALQKNCLLDVWDDSRIGAGADWYREIQQAVDSAKVAILLVSANFLSSEFVLHEEVPPLLERRHNDGLRVIPIIVTPCVWQQVEWLRKMQVALLRDRPLSAGSPYQIDAYLTDIAERVIKIVMGSPPEPPIVDIGVTDDTPPPVHRGSLRIVIVDDHAIVRHGLSRSIQFVEGMEVVGQAADGHSAVELARELLPDIMIMDINMPDGNGIEATREIHRDLPGVKIVALAMESARRNITEMFRAGASGYVLKDCEFGELLLAIRTVAEGKTYISPSIGNIVVEDLGPMRQKAEGEPLSLLTSREREVLELRVQGLSAKQIAMRLFISPKTVEAHCLRIMHKLEIDNVAQLTKYAIQKGLIPTDP